METIGQAISRVKNTLKIIDDDAFITDRYIYSLLLKYSKTLIKRDSRIQNIFKMTNLFKEIPCMDLEEVGAIEACCGGLKTKCTFRRTKELPKIMTLNNGPIISSVNSLDYSVRAHLTTPELYSNMKKSVNFKYNKTVYYWIINNRIYLPVVEWEAIKLSALFEDDVSQYQCYNNSEESGVCINEQDRDFNIPEDLFSEIEQLVRQEILIKVQIPSEGPDNNQNIMR